MDESGVVTAIAQGEATITASTQNEVSASCSVTVIKQPAPAGTSGGSTGGGTTGGSNGGSGSSGGSTQGGQDNGGGNGGGAGGGQPAPTQLTDDQIKTAISAAKDHARGLGFTIVETRQPGHGIASTAYYDYDAFLQNLKDNVNTVAGMFAGENLSLVNLCFVQEGNSVYVTYG